MLPRRHIVLMVPADNFIALAAIRSLGRRAVRVVALSGTDGIGRYSRYCWRACAGPLQGADFTSRVWELVQKYDISHVMCSQEKAIILLNEDRRLFETRAKLLFPPREIFDLALYKDRTLRIAESLGMDTPRTVLLDSDADIPACADLQYPVILKPRHQDARNTAGRLPFKIRYASSHAELVRMLAALGPVNDYPLVQEYVPGYGVGVNVLMHAGTAVQLFQHRRIREFPPSGGVSVFCQSVALESGLADQSVALLRRMNWEGAAMVEYRRDPRSGRTVLMEVNGRFWGSLPLAVHAGADFPYLLYRCSEGAAPAGAAYRVGVRCRSLAGDTKWLCSVWRNASERRLSALLRYVAGFRPGTRYFAWSATDPLPAVMNFVLRLRRVCMRAGRALSERLAKRAALLAGR